MNESRRFEVKGLLGEGGFGSVYLADMVSAGGFRKEVALKVLRAEITSGSQAEVRLRDEARLLGLLRHRNIVSADDLVRFPEGWGVVMEYVPGVDLGVFITHLKRKGASVPARAALDLVRGVAKALDTAYQHPKADGEPLRAIHRDIKPGNIRITPDGEVKVLDFGIARADFDEREAVTGDARFGSLAYMSPERVLGDPGSPAGDIYALGVVFWETLAGQQRGRAKLRPEEHEAQVQSMVMASQVPAELRSLIGAMVAYEASARPTAADVVERIRALQATLAGPELESVAPKVIPEILAGLRMHEIPTGLAFHPITQGEDTQSTASFHWPAGGPPVEGSTPPEPRRRPGVFLALGIGFVFLVGIGGYQAVRMLKGPSTAPPLVHGVQPQAAGASDASASPPVPAPEPRAASRAAPPLAVEPVPSAEPVANPDRTPRAEPSAAAASTSTKAPPAPRPSATEASPSSPPGGEPSVTESEAMRLRGVKFSVEGATRMAAECAGSRGSGAASVLVRNVPVGECTVEATVGGATLTGRVLVESPRMYRCAVEGDLLRCQ